MKPFVFRVNYILHTPDMITGTYNHSVDCTVNSIEYTILLDNNYKLINIPKEIINEQQEFLQQEIYNIVKKWSIK